MVTPHPIPTDPRFIDYSGQTFWRLKVISYAGRGDGATLWNCVCECGKETVVAGPKLKCGFTKSCGCLCHERLAKFNTTHGRAHTPIHNAWKTMKARCSNKKNKSFPRYGGRGITVCERWMTFENFLSDMGDRPDKTYSIERLDNNRGYEPGNCVWAKAKTQGRNKSNNRLISACGTTLTLSEWCEMTGLGPSTISDRIKRGWDVEDALTTPT